MARRRMIEVSIAHDKALNSLSDFAQLLYLKILPHTDDYGRFEGDPVLVKARVDPLTTKPAKKFEAAMAEIAAAGLWMWYKTETGKMVVQYKPETFNRINAFLIKKRGNPEYEEYKESYQLISSDIPGISHRQYKVESIKQKEESKKSGFVAPSEQEVIDYFVANGFPASVASKAFKYYTQGNWTDAKGSPVKNWKQKMISVWFKEENRGPAKPTVRGPKLKRCKRCGLEYNDIMCPRCYPEKSEKRKEIPMPKEVADAIAKIGK